jgi:hypothetical protein
MANIPALERLAFFPGELLTAADLTAIDTNNRELRWLHNRTLHNWGIAIGLDVQGKRGDTLVSVNPGYAVDVEGREIILAAPVSQPIPAVPGASGGGPAIYYLVANYVDDAAEPVEEQRSATACGPGGAVRLSNDPAIRWRAAAQLVFGIDVILAAVAIHNCVLAADPSAAVRRYAFAGTSPYVAAARVAAAALTWQSLGPGQIKGAKATIDTTAARFQSTPNYMVEVVGNRTLDSGVVVDIASIADASAADFTLQLTFLGQVDPGDITKLGWEISWMGVEG